MVNYDLPWNPNRLEQRFGRIHRIGQTEVCHLWNLVADETREGDVYHRYSKNWRKRARRWAARCSTYWQASFDGKPLRDLLNQAIRYGEKPEVRACLNRSSTTHSIDRSCKTSWKSVPWLTIRWMLAAFIAFVKTWNEPRLDVSSRIISSRSFLKAFKRLGGTVKQREPRRYEVTHVPAHSQSRPAHRDRRNGAAALRAHRI